MNKNSMQLYEFFGTIVKAKRNYHLNFIWHEFYNIWPNLGCLRLLCGIMGQKLISCYVHFCKSFNNLTASGHIQFKTFLCQIPLGWEQLKTVQLKTKLTTLVYHVIRLLLCKTFWKIETAHTIFWMYLGGTA